MQFFIAALLAISTIVAAAPAPVPAPAPATVDTSAFEVSNLSIQKIQGTITISFSVHDPNPLTNATEVCKGSWSAASNDYPKDTYSACGSAFAWNMQSFKSIRSFQLGLEHAYVDDAVGPPPMNWITNFGHGNVSSDLMSCKTKNGALSCLQNTPKPIRATIYASIA